VWRWDQQEPFGNNAADEDPDANSVAFDLPLRLPGQRYDKETGLHYNYFRNYDPSLGRYGESDPLGLKGGLNTYAYVGGSPIARVDPLGRDYVLMYPMLENPGPSPTSCVVDCYMKYALLCAAAGMGAGAAATATTGVGGLPAAAVSVVVSQSCSVSFIWPYCRDLCNPPMCPPKRIPLPSLDPNADPGGYGIPTF